MAARFTLAFFVISRMETRSKPCSLNNSSATSRMRQRVSFNCFIRSFQTIVYIEGSRQLIPDYSWNPKKEAKRGERKQTKVLLLVRTSARGSVTPSPWGEGWGEGECLTLNPARNLTIPVVFSCAAA